MTRAAVILAALLALGADGQRRVIVPPGDGLAAQGEEVFWRQGCYGCHTIGQAGTPIAADLSHIGARHSEAWLQRWLRDPEAQVPTAHMPRLELTGQEVDALAAFLAWLH